ncbi:MAG: anaerobic ribonucleoside-triphosphate reductase activating protein [Spirochaetaceae bacterium]|jgi:pyruvate formate lyase activating enzyme|nr:anaerobic ribonucleoside-triphosphate reductase activating protein [Spirochaetaceae bacterium]
MLKNDLVYFRKTTLVDYPEKVAAAIFFRPCNLRCPWCHNGSLITINEAQNDDSQMTAIEDALDHIKKRAGVLDGVVLSGGEPAMYGSLEELVAEIKNQSLSVKLDTNGTVPRVLAGLLQSDMPPDFIAMDLKVSPARYKTLSPAHKEFENEIRESARLIREAWENGRIQAEFRSLALPRLFFGENDIEELSALAGGVPWVIRPFRPGSCLDPSWNNEIETTDMELKKLSEFARNTAKTRGRHG